GIGNSIGLIDSNGSTSIFQIVGICEGNPFIHGGEYLYIDTSLFQQLWLKSSVKWFMADVDITYVIPDAEANIESFFPDLKSVQTTYSYISLLRYSLQTQGAFINLIFVHSFLLSGLTQFIGILITTLRMEREVAIMRALGLSTVDVLGLFLTESSILGFTGVVVGIINSSIGASLLAWYISLSIPIQVALNSIRDQFLFMLWIGLSIVVTLASTYIPSKRASEVNIIAAISGRREMKDAIGIYEPVEFDVKAVIETMNVPVERKIGPGKQVEDAEIQDLIAKITKYKDKIDLEVKEDKDWFDLYQSQQTKYRNGELDSLKFSYTARRFLNYLKEK
ncbi:ABC transporter permease, partial [Candidatus Hodarchaeum mangrovi]